MHLSSAQDFVIIVVVLLCAVPLLYLAFKNRSSTRNTASRRVAPQAQVDRLAMMVAAKHSQQVE